MLLADGGWGWVGWVHSAYSTEGMYCQKLEINDPGNLELDSVLSQFAPKLFVMPFCV